MVANTIINKIGNVTQIRLRRSFFGNYVLQIKRDLSHIRLGTLGLSSEVISISETDWTDAYDIDMPDVYKGGFLGK